MAHAEHASDKEYYFPHGSRLPFFGSLSLFILMAGAAATLNGTAIGGWVLGLGFVLLFTLFFLWFGEVIRENQAGLYNEQVDRSFRMGMMWFIFSEVMFFAAFFGALFYMRIVSVPDLGSLESQALVWPGFKPGWPVSGPGITEQFTPMGAMGIPLLNTIILLSSGFTLTVAHHALKAGHRGALKLWLFATIVLGFTFLGFQVYEYVHAYTALNLKLSTGVYGSTFFMLTGFHGAHVTIGAIML